MAAGHSLQSLFTIWWKSMIKVQIKGSIYSIDEKPGLLNKPPNFHAVKDLSNIEEETKNSVSKVGFIHSNSLVVILAKRIKELEDVVKQQSLLWTVPTPEMVQAGLCEVQTCLGTLNDEGVISFNDEGPSDDRASDIALFALQAMASKLPK